MTDAAIRIDPDGKVTLNMDAIRRIAAKDGPNASHATFAHAILAARSAALEEAAKVADKRAEDQSDNSWMAADAIAAAIRELKGK